MVKQIILSLLSLPIILSSQVRKVNTECSPKFEIGSSNHIEFGDTNGDNFHFGFLFHQKFTSKVSLNAYVSSTPGNSYIGGSVGKYFKLNDEKEIEFFTLLGGSSTWYNKRISEQTYYKMKGHEYNLSYGFQKKLNLFAFSVYGKTSIQDVSKLTILTDNIQIENFKEEKEFANKSPYFTQGFGISIGIYGDGIGMYSSNDFIYGGNNSPFNLRNTTLGLMVTSQFVLNKFRSLTKSDNYSKEEE